jgi:hypothetical protein
MSVTLLERLLHLSEVWAVSQNRSESTLGSRVAKDGKFFDRVRAGSGCNVATAERFFTFFRQPGNWPDNAIPDRVGDLLDGIDVGVVVDHERSDNRSDCLQSSGKIEASSHQVPA